jgi:AraC-like DNA-binding protein
VGPAGDNAEHAHHAVQVCVALAGQVEIAARGCQHRAAGLSIDADVPHRLTARDVDVALVYLEPETRDGLRLRSARDNVAALAPALALRLIGLARNAASSVDVRSARAAHENLVAALQPTALDVRKMDSRVGKALALARSNPAHYPSVASLAHAVALSPSRFRDLFARDATISCRRYLVWLRLQRAMAAAARGESLTTAAHGAGFADSGHLTRAFRAMFGVAPSALTRDVRFIAE